MNNTVTVRSFAAAEPLSVSFVVDYSRHSHWLRPVSRLLNTPLKTKRTRSRPVRCRALPLLTALRHKLGTLSTAENPNDVGPKPSRFGDATWQSSLDSSRVWAQKVNGIHAGTDASCPNTGAIDCPLLQTIGSDEGPTGGKALTRTTFIQRLNTNGGSAPASGCSVASDIGKQTLVPYSADYFFFRADQ